MGLPLSAEATEALRKLQVTRLGHLSGLRLSSFEEVSSHGSSIFIQMALLLKRVRSVKLATQAREYAHLMNATSLEHETIWLPPEARDIPISNLQLSYRVYSVFERAGIKLSGQLHGVSMWDISLLKHCGPKTMAELREIVSQLNGKVTQRNYVTPKCKTKRIRQTTPVSVSPTREPTPTYIPASNTVLRATSDRGVDDADGNRLQAASKSMPPPPSV